ncbi:cystatin-C-like [Mobula hypostoma]|uniref:cystatin-C-like n=1 Tax=Mobula hypostoma TaxID=723540 RepID=UPI002FC2E73C
MAAWQLAFALFSVTLLSVCAETKHQVQEIQQLAQTQQVKPLLLKVDTSDVNFQKIANFAVEKFSSEQGSLYKILQYVNAKAQVLEGVIYVMDVLIGKTDCPAARAGTKAEDCEVLLGTAASKFFLCHYLLWSVPPFKEQKLLKQDCVELKF